MEKRRRKETFFHIFALQIFENDKLIANKIFRTINKFQAPPRNLKRQKHKRNGKKHKNLRKGSFLF